MIFIVQIEDGTVQAKTERENETNSELSLMKMFRRWTSQVSGIT